MNKNMLPSQFLSVVLEEPNKGASHKCFSQSNIKRENLCLPNFMSDSVIITPVTINKSKLKRVHRSISNKVLKNNEKYDFSKYFPPIVLEECIIEFADGNIPKSSTQKQRKITNGSSSFGKYSKKSVFQKNKNLHRTEENIDVRDIMTQVEAVYSDGEENNDNAEDEDLEEELIGKYFVSNGFGKVNGKNDFNDNCLTDVATTEEYESGSNNKNEACECPLCGRKFLRNCSLALHMKCHSDEQTCSCKICGKKFSRLSVLEKHFQKHSAVNFGYCKLCPKVFPDQESLRIHTAISHTSTTTTTTVEKFSCELCNITFKRKQLLDLHFDITHNRGKLPFICKICKARFGNLKDLSEHNASHTSEKLQMICQHCGETYVQKSAYKKHLLTHSAERLSCDICTAEFTQRSSLLRHLKKLHGIITPPTVNIPNAGNVNGNNKIIFDTNNIKNNNNNIDYVFSKNMNVSAAQSV